MMPLGTGLALSTLRALARRQGVRDDPATEEQPGKILHEVRSGTVRLAGMVLPPVYYGTRRRHPAVRVHAAPTRGGRRRPATRWPRCCPPYAAAWRG